MIVCAHLSHQGEPTSGNEHLLGAVQDTAAARKKARAIKPGSFLSLLVNARHTDSGEPLSEMEAAAQAFTFLLAGAQVMCSVCELILTCTEEVRHCVAAHCMPSHSLCATLQGCHPLVCVRCREAQLWLAI